MGDKLNVPKYVKQINLAVVIEKYVGNMIKDNSIEFYNRYIELNSVIGN